MQQITISQGNVHFYENHLFLAGLPSALEWLQNHEGSSLPLWVNLGHSRQYTHFMPKVVICWSKG